MKCPNCKLENPDDALRCDCGFEFSSGEIKNSYINIDNEKPTLPLLILGWVFSFLGGWLGIIIACYIIFAKNKQIKTIRRYNNKSRKIGYIMLVVSIISTILSIYIRSLN